MTPYKILIVDDAPDNITILHSILAPLQCKVVVANSGSRALEMVARAQPDLILLDVMMPEMDGFEVCRRLRANPATAAIPVIFVTARLTEVSEGFAAGGNDYIPKPINPPEVLARVRHQLERLTLIRDLTRSNERLEQAVQERTAELLNANRQLREEIRERRFMQDRLRYLAEHDFVTRVYNRNALDAHVSALLANMQTHNGLRAVYLQLDIDQFRLINESLGCIAGDELLLQMAEVFAACLEKGDFLARLGGDNFAIVCEGRSEIEGIALGQRIQAQVKAHAFHWEEREYPVSVTVAVVAISPKVSRFEQLLIMGDETLFLAKKQGRDSLYCYDEHTPDAVAHRNNIHWALRLASAIRNNQLRVFVQQICPTQGIQDTENADGQGQDLGQGRKIKFEALVRLWDEQTRQIILPEEMIPVAERFDLVQDIDRWMIENVVAFLAEHAALHPLIDSISVNISARTLNDRTLQQFILGVIERHQIPPHLLVFEITETERLNNLEEVQLLMHMLRQQGFRFALDDFGSGYASMNYLHDLPFDIVKIDGQLVRDLDRNGAHAAMVFSLVEIAHTLDKEIVVESVVSEQIARIVQGFNVQWGQGFYFHQPEPISATLNLIPHHASPLAG